MDIVISKKQETALINLIDKVAKEYKSFRNDPEWRNDWLIIKRISKNKGSYIYKFNDLILDTNKTELAALINWINVELQQQWSKEKTLLELDEKLTTTYKLYDNRRKKKKITSLHLTLKKHWFDMISSGLKIEEYREIKDYWTKRLIHPDGTPKKFVSVVFKNGYKKDAPKIEVEFNGIYIREGYEIWGAEKNKKYYVIQLGNVYEDGLPF